MVIEPKGLWEHSAYQTDNRFIIEVKPIQEDPNKLTQGTRGGYKGEKLSLNFQNIDVRAVLQVIADFTGLNIITSDTVQGSLTLRLKDMPWDQALDIILQTKGLDMRKNGNVVLIAPREELALQGEAAARVAGADRRPRAAADGDVPAQLREGRGHPQHRECPESDAAATAPPAARARSCRSRGDGVVDPRTNILFVQDIAVAARGSAPDHPPDRHVGAAGADRGADRHRRRQVQPPARRALRPADRVHAQLRPLYGSASGGSLSTQPGRDPSSLGRSDRLAPRDADADAVRSSASGIAAIRATRIRRSSTSTCRSPRTPPGQLGADADQPRQRQPDQPRAVGARSRQPRQGGVEPARDDGRQPEGAHRAGHGNSVRDAAAARTTPATVRSRRRCCGSTSRRRSRRTTASS